MDEMRESTRIVQQCLDGMPEGPWIVDDRKIVLPPRHELHTSMESLIHHFKLVTEGHRVPAGEVYAPRVRTRRAWVLCRLRRRVEALAREVPRPLLRRPRGDGDHRCGIAGFTLIAILGSLDTVSGDCDRLMAPEALYDEIQTIAARYPQRLSAVMPMLRLAQERYGWLPPDAFREVGEALDLTPAYCKAAAASTTCSISSLYGHDRGLHQRLVRVGLRSRCSRPSKESSVSTPARRPRTASSRSARSSARRLRLGTVVSVDHRYRESVKPGGRARHRRGAPQCLGVTGR